jgi:hypothetical protein
VNTAARLGVYALGLAVIFGGALGVGNAVGAGGPAPAPTPAHSAHAGQPATPAQAEHAGDHAPGGLQISQGGYTLAPVTRTIKAGRPTDFRFVITKADGAPVTGFEVQHDKRMHFIVVSRDLGTFQHLHPEQSPGGEWTVKLTLPEAGVYRAFADFLPTGGSALTLGADLMVAGTYQPRPLPEPDRVATVDGYTVTLDGALAPGATRRLTATISKDGEMVTDLQPYLGAFGHLVALRAGDLAYLHVHPDGQPRDGRATSGPQVSFLAEAPSGGDYRLFLDFKHDGEVRTAAFTVPARGVGPGGPQGGHSH